MPGELYIEGVPSVYIENVDGDVYVSRGATPQEPAPGGMIRCKKDVRECPDGSHVGRVGPDCQFSPCPDNPEGELDSLLFNARRFMVEGILEQYLTGATAGAFLYNTIYRIEESKLAVESLGREISGRGAFSPIPVPAVPPSVAVLEFVMGSEPAPVYAERFRSRYAGGFPVLPQNDPSLVFVRVDPGQESRLMEVISNASIDPAFGAEVLLSFRS